MGPPVLRIRLLGELSLEVGGIPIPPLESARVESLLAYLVLHRDAPQSRQRLAFLVWPDSSERQARTNLRHVLHNLRRALPGADEYLEVTARTLRWRPGAPLWLDAAAFEAALDRGAFMEAVDIYTGELLQGSYEDWLLVERARLHDGYVDALDRLCDEAHDRLAHLAISRARTRSQRCGRRGIVEAWAFTARLDEAHGQTEVGAQDVDARLALLIPVLAETRHRMHARKPYCRLNMPELLRGGPKPVGEESLVVAVALAFLDPVPPIGDRKRHNCPEPRPRRRGPP